MQIKSESEVGALHSSKTILVNEILKLAKEINQECFYGRFLANAVRNKKYFRFLK